MVKGTHGSIFVFISLNIFATVLCFTNYLDDLPSPFAADNYEARVKLDCTLYERNEMITTRMIGHTICAGVTYLSRNGFGKDFSENKRKNGNWTTLCPLDSDGDGRTNGEELGDPNCGGVSSGALSHPGYKESEIDNNGIKSYPVAYSSISNSEEATACGNWISLC